MRRSMNRATVGPRCILGLGLVLIGLIQTSDLSAQVTAAVYNGEGDFAFDVQSMPDLDQERNGLPNDGSMYCIPTSCMNLCAFAANFGFPGLAPGPGFWQGAVGHQNMTNAIGFMGLPEFMDTDPLEGTDGSDKIFGMEAWIQASSQPMFICSAYPDEDYWPTIDRAAVHAVNGAIVQLSYGRYFWQEIANRPYLTNRDGGHGVTLKLAFANNGQLEGPRLIHYRNPASDDGDLFSNSVFTSTFPDSAENILIGTDIYSDIATDYIATSLFNPPFISDDDNRYRIIDSFLALYPGGALFWSGTQVNSIFVNGNLGFAQDQQPVPYSPSQGFGQSVLAAIPYVEPHSNLVLVQTATNTKLVQAFHGGRFEELGTLPSDVRHLTPGFGHTVYAASNARVYVIKVVPGRPAQVINTAPLPPGSAGVDAIVYMDRIRALIAVTQQKAHLYTRIDSQNPFVRTFDIDGFPSPSTRIRRMSVHQDPTGRESTIAVTTEFPAGVAELEFPRPSFSTANQIGVLDVVPLVLPGVVEPVSAEFDDSGRLYVSDIASGLLEFVIHPQLGWIPAHPLYINLPLQGRPFMPFRNRTNIRAKDLDPAQWFNIDPEELAPLGPEIND